MYNIDVDTTIDNITQTLADNEQPPIRGAPTQHAINEHYIEFKMHYILRYARLPGIDVTSGINSLHRFVGSPTRHCFQIRCRQCGFRFQDRSKAYELDELGELHANRNNHEVLLSLRYGGFEVEMTILPIKRSRWETFLNWFGFQSRRRLPDYIGV